MTQPLTHNQFEGWIGQWFLDRGWGPALSEVQAGYVKDGGRLPRWAKNDSDYLDMMMNFYKMPEERAREELQRAHDRGWIADVAGVVWSNVTKMKDMGLYRIFKSEMMTYGQWTWLCEVKVTRADFLQDDKWDAPPQANLQFVAYPKGLIGPGEVPKGWIGLEALTITGQKRVKKHTKKAVFHQIAEKQRYQLIENLMWALWWRGSRLAEVELAQKLWNELQQEGA